MAPNPRERRSEALKEIRRLTKEIDQATIRYTMGAGNDIRQDVPDNLIKIITLFKEFEKWDDQVRGNVQGKLF